MKIRVYVKIGRREGLLGWDGERLTVCVNAPPVEGTANARLVEILSEWLGVNKSSITIVKGRTSRYKILEVDTNIKAFNALVDDLPKIAKQERLF